MPTEPPRASTASPPFDSIYRHDFARVVAAIPVVGVGDIEHNAQRIIELAHEAHTDHAAVVVFPELGLVGYSAQDLFHQRAIVDGCLARLAEVCAATESLRPLLIIGAPIRVGHALFNTAVVLHRGRILGVVPKSYLPNYREFYEKRHFSAARQATASTVDLLGQAVPFGTDLLFRAADVPDLLVSVEICEDLWVPVPPSTFACLAGATVVVNPSGSNITIAKAGYRRELCSSHSARTFSAYVYAGAGSGESTTDLAWDGHGIIAENGTIVAEGRRFAERRSA